MKQIILLLIALSLWGCATIKPGNDPVVVRAEAFRGVAVATLDTYVNLELRNRQLLWDTDKGFFKVAQKIRAGTKGWLASFDRTLASYKASRTDQNKVSLEGATEVIQTALNEAQTYLVKATEKGIK